MCWCAGADGLFCRLRVVVFLRVSVSGGCDFWLALRVGGWFVYCGGFMDCAGFGLR